MRDHISYGEKYGKAIRINDEEEAKAYFIECVEHQMRIGGYSRNEAEKIERSNIGYWAGYASDEDRRRVRRLYGATHPIFDDMAVVYDSRGL